MVLCHLVAALALFAYMMQFAVTNNKKYPPAIDCEAVNSQFLNSTGGVDYAVGSPYWTYAGVDEPYTVNEEGSGIYQCYCRGTINPAT